LFSNHAQVHQNASAITEPERPNKGHVSNRFLLYIFIAKS